MSANSSSSPGGASSNRSRASVRSRVAATPERPSSAPSSASMRRRYPSRRSANAREASSSRTVTAPGAPCASGRSSTSASECAGSAERSSTRCDQRAAASSAVAAAADVLPTPPLPPNTTSLRAGGQRRPPRSGRAGLRRGRSASRTRRRGQARPRAQARKSQSTARLRRLCGQPGHRQRPPPHGGEDAALRAHTRIAEPARRGGTRRDAVHQQVLPRQAALTERGQPVQRLLPGQRLGQRHPGERAALEQAPERVRLRFQLRDEPIGLVRRPALQPSAGRQEPVLGLHVVEHARDLSELRGHLEEPEGVAGGRGVHHHLVVGPRAGEAQQLEQAHELVHAGQGQAQEAVDVVRAQVGAAHGEVAQERPCAPIQLAERARASTSAARSGRGCRGRRGPPGPAARPGVAEGMGGIGGDDEDRWPARAGARRPRRWSCRPRPCRRRSGTGASALAVLVLVAGEARLDAGTPSTRSRRAGARSPPSISRMRGRRSVSISGNSSSVISPSSRRICAARSSSRRTVSSLSSLVHRLHELVEDEADAADQQAVDEDHHRRSPTRLAGALQLEADVDEVVGRPGPVYLKVSVSYRAPISFTLASKAASFSRATRKAAFMIILSPIGLLAREATDTGAQLLEDVASRSAPSAPRRAASTSAAVLHAREVGRALLGRDLVLEPPHVLVLALDLADDRRRGPTAP